jgi:hypothetical protein
MKSTRYSCQILMKPGLSRRIFGKYSNNKLNENPSSGNRVVPCGRTDTTKPIVTFAILRTRLTVEFSFMQCTSYDPQNKQLTNYLHSTQRVISLTEVSCVHFEVRTASLYKMHIHFGLHMVKAIWQVLTPIYIIKIPN